MNTKYFAAYLPYLANPWRKFSYERVILVFCYIGPWFVLVSPLKSKEVVKAKRTGREAMEVENQEEK